MSRQLDDFFPFDPLLLKHSATLIAPLYQVWQVIMYVLMTYQVIIMHVLMHRWCMFYMQLCKFLPHAAFPRVTAARHDAHAARE